MSDSFTNLSVIILITTCISILMKSLKQPLILGYILTGLLLGPFVFNIIGSTELIESFSTIGIALLLFIIGLGMDIRGLGKLGKTVLLIVCAILGVVSTVGFIISMIFGYFGKEAFLIGLALFFSSTIIIVKLLSDKKEQNRLHGQIAIGVILVDDIIATLALLFIAASANGGLQLNEIFLLIIKGVVIIGLLTFCSIKILPKLTRYIANSQELLFLAAMAWGFGIASLFEHTGFSIEIGALFAGVALANSPYAREIGARLKPLRDFFIILFFISLGESMNLASISSSIVPALILSIAVIILKPLVILITMGLMGYSKHVSFKTGVHLSQISEFSIIMILLAVNSKVINEDVGTLITLVAIITISVSTYLMLYDDAIYNKFILRLKMKLFEREVTKKERSKRASTQLLLFGYNDGGSDFIKVFKGLNKRYLVIDYDPSVIEYLDNNEIPAIYGDATDNEFLEELGLGHIELIVSTFTDFESTKQMVASCTQLAPNSTIICQANNQTEALELYEMGCTYVVISHHIVGNERVSGFIKRNGYKKREFQEYREKHITKINKRLELDTFY